jgi:hypothetical protein
MTFWSDQWPILVPPATEFDRNKRQRADANTDASPDEGGAMTTTTHATAVVATVDSTAEDRVRQAARRLFEAELALHDAHQSHVDQWIGAAADRLHEAVINYRFALATSSY